MKECMECGQEYDESKRTSEWWVRQHKAMGACAWLCNACWLKEYKIDVTDK